MTTRVEGKVSEKKAPGSERIQALIRQLDLEQREREFTVEDEPVLIVSAPEALKKPRWLLRSVPFLSIGLILLGFGLVHGMQRKPALDAKTTERVQSVVNELLSYQNSETGQVKLRKLCQGRRALPVVDVPMRCYADFANHDGTGPVKELWVQTYSDVQLTETAKYEAVVIWRPEGMQYFGQGQLDQEFPSSDG